MKIWTSLSGDYIPLLEFGDDAPWFNGKTPPDDGSILLLPNEEQITVKVRAEGVSEGKRVYIVLAGKGVNTSVIATTNSLGEAKAFLTVPPGFNRIFTYIENIEQ